MSFTVRNQTRDKLLADRAEEATTFLTRFKGLMGRTADHFPFGSGLLIAPCNSIHSFFMRMPIDALFLDDQRVVVKLLAPMSPWRMSRVYFAAHAVLELPAGTVVGSGTREGDQLVFEGHARRANFL